MPHRLFGVGLSGCWFGLSSSARSTARLFPEVVQMDIETCQSQRSHVAPFNFSPAISCWARDTHYAAATVPPTPSPRSYIHTDSHALFSCSDPSAHLSLHSFPRHIDNFPYAPSCRPSIYTPLLLNPLEGVRRNIFMHPILSPRSFSFIRVHFLCERGGYKSC